MSYLVEKVDGGSNRAGLLKILKPSEGKVAIT